MKLVMLDEVVMKAPVILSLVVLVTLQVSLSLGGSPYHVEVSLEPFIRAGGGSIPLDLTSVQMVTPISSPVGTSIGGEDVEFNFSLEATFAAVARARTREPFIYNNGRALNRENPRLFCRLNDILDRAYRDKRKK